MVYAIWQASTAGWNKFDSFLTKFDELEKRSKIDLAEHIEIHKKDSIQFATNVALRDSILNLQGQVEAQQEALLDIKNNFLPTGKTTFMNRIKISPNFYLDEFVPKEIYEAFGAKAIWFVSKEQVSIAEAVRVRYGRTTINDYIHGGSYNWCGFRTPDCPTGAKLSQHKCKCANDHHIEGVIDYEEIRRDVLANQKYFMAAGATTIEAGTNGWLHMDGRVTNMTEIFVVPFQ